MNVAARKQNANNSPLPRWKMRREQKMAAAEAVAHSQSEITAKSAPEMRADKKLPLGSGVTQMKCSGGDDRGGIGDGDRRGRSDLAIDVRFGEGEEIDGKTDQPRGGGGNDELNYRRQAREEKVIEPAEVFEVFKLLFDRKLALAGAASGEMYGDLRGFCTPHLQISSRPIL